MLIKSAGKRGVMFLGNLSAGRYCTYIWIHMITRVTRYGVCVPKEEEGGRWVGKGMPLPRASSQRTARLWDWDLALSC